MVPNVARKGTSFKGSALYYLHDKRQPGEAERLTSDRVAWTETRNLNTDDPDKAWRMMAGTAMDADKLKEKAGIKKGGRKGEGQAVYAYSLSWSDAEHGKIDRAEMQRAVDESLKKLGAHHLQAMVVCHQDEQHPHVHVILNRVDPTTGTLWTASNDFKTLDKWAYQYRKQRGEEHLYCPDRTKKHEAQAQKRDQKKDVPAPVKRPSPEEVRAKEMQRPKSKAAMLAEFQAQQKEQHSKEWAELRERGKVRRDPIVKASLQAIAAAKAAQKEADKQFWRDWFKEDRAERRQFDRQERELVGIVRNVFGMAQRGGLMSAGRGFLTMAFMCLASAVVRRAAFEQQQQEKRAAFADKLKAPLDVKIARIKTERFDQLAQANRAFQAERAALMAKQKGEREKIREAWKQIYAEREARRLAAGDQSKFYQKRGKGPWQKAPPRPSPDLAARPAATARSNPAPAGQPEERPVRPQFDKTALEIETKAPPRVPLQKVEVSAPQPVPSPAGITPAPSQVVNVPKIDKAAEFAKTEEGRAIVAKQAPKAAPDSPRREAQDKFPPQMQERPKVAPEPPKQERPVAPRKGEFKDYWNSPDSPAMQPMRPQKGEFKDYWNAPDSPTQPKPEQLAEAKKDRPSIWDTDTQYRRPDRDQSPPEPDRDRTRRPRR